MTIQRALLNSYLCTNVGFMKAWVYAPVFYAVLYCFCLKYTALYTMHLLYKRVEREKSGCLSNTCKTAFPCRQFACCGSVADRKKNFSNILIHKPFPCSWVMGVGWHTNNSKISVETSGQRVRGPDIRGQCLSDAFVPHYRDLLDWPCSAKLKSLPYLTFSQSKGVLYSFSSHLHDQYRRHQ